MNDSPGPALAEALRALHGAIDRYDIVAARTLGIGRNDWRALRLLAEQGPQAPRALGEALGLTSGSVTTLIDRLEARGLALRSPDPGDRRSLVVSASVAGAKALRSAYAPLADITGRSAARLGEGRSAAAAKQIADLARLVDWAREKL
jgi:DNA-binding MarR family transcriptional regulator